MKTPQSTPNLVARKVWLTFDDGPCSDCTSRILDTLAELNVKATFFVVGSCVERTGRALLERMEREGHLIGNHGYSHRNLTTLPEHEVREEITRTGETLAGLPNAKMLFRPPYGTTNALVDRIVLELGYRRVLWNVDSRDWDPAWQPDLWVERTVQAVREREWSIILAHDIHPTTADGLATLIRRLCDVTFECPAEY
jgi:peptidoglycan/xylan/chitin deacetylase (PgdA/CDA1 family)